MRVLDLFSGIGGFSLGLEAAGMTTVAFCEREPFCQAVLKKHWPDIPCHDDVTTLDGKQYNGTIDVIAGGFPCQDLSLAGKGAGLAGERSGLWFEYLRIIKEAQPRYVIIENVSALRSRGLEEVLRSLAEIGYDAEWHCIPASAVGAPHRHDRVWIVAYAAGNGRRQGNANPRGGAEGICQREEHRPADGCETMADTQGEQNGRLRQQGVLPNTGASGESLSDPMREGLEGQRTITSRIAEELENFSNLRRWDIEPDVGRVADGVPLRVHRLRGLGNSIVPQIAQIIGEAILKAEGNLI